MKTVPSRFAYPADVVLSGSGRSDNYSGMRTEAGVVDGEAFASFYRDHYAALVGFFLRRLDDRELARDMTAETFRIAWSRWLADDQLSRGWLFGVARNLVGDEWRRRARNGPLDELPEALQSTDGHQAADVRLVLGSLTPAERDVLVLTYWDGLSAAEVAVALTISRANVWTRLHRARRAFAEAWHGAAPPDAPSHTPAQPRSAKGSS